MHTKETSRSEIKEYDNVRWFKIVVVLIEKNEIKEYDNIIEMVPDCNHSGD